MKHETVFLAPEVVLGRFIQETGAPIDEICGCQTTREITRLRHEAMWLLRMLTSAGLAQIGEMFGRSSATVDEAIDKITRRATTDDDYRRRLASLRETIVQGARQRIDDPAGSEWIGIVAAAHVLGDETLSDTEARHAARVLLGKAVAARKSSMEF